MSPEAGTFFMFSLMLLLLVAGAPVVFVFGSIALIGSTIFLGVNGLFLAAGVVYKTWANPTILALPFFIFMANVLQRSGIAEQGYDMIYKWSGGIRGGLASGTVVLCTIFAATVGSGAVAVVSIGLIAVPIMLNRGYDKSLTLGSVMSGSVLGIIIPPSVLMILYGLVTRVSIGALYFGGIIPGLIGATILIIYISIRSHYNPKLAPALPPAERVSFKEKLVSFRAMAMPIFLIVLVLGSIWLGVCTATEAGALGAVGALICAAIHRRLNWTMFKEASTVTFKILGMSGWILASAMLFNAVYISTGARQLIEGMTVGFGLNPWLIIIIMNLSIFIAGMLMDDFAIVVLFGPIYHSIAVGLGLNPLWWGIVFILNLQMAYLTPPFGFNLFYMRALIPQIKDKFPADLEISQGDIYRSILPFIALQMVILILVMIYSPLATWLPDKMIK